MGDKFAEVWQSDRCPATLKKMSIIVAKRGSESTVVWNPWIEKTKGMSDMAPNGWKKMICVETANVADNAVHLPPGASQRLTASIRVE
jgi:D-hexose-6-phosphate mutarotase